MTASRWRRSWQNPTLVILTDRNTKAVFGDYIDVYDIQQAVEDKATVPIYYEGRLAKIAPREEERPRIDPEFEEVTEGEEERSKERLKSKWARLEAMVGADRRIGLVAADIVEHFERRQEALANRFKNPDDPLRLVIVRDMWLTGFDAPSLHTMYVDKPMRGHGLMQAIARVNRVFRDKPGGLVVDYLGLADQLKEALAAYTEGDRSQAGIPQEQSVVVLQEKFEVADAMFHGFDHSGWVAAPPAGKLALIPAAKEHVLRQPDGKKRFAEAVGDLSKAFALAVPDLRALALRDTIAFFQAVRAAFAKARPEGERDPEDVDTAVRQLVSRAVAPEGVIDIFSAAGLQKPDISILSDEFLAEVRALPHRNVALELLQKLLNDEIRRQSQRNVVQARAFSEMLERAIRQYQNRAIETAQVIAELIELAREMRAAQDRGEALGLSDEELAFYDALAQNESAVDVLGDDTLRGIARELVRLVRQNASIDWTRRESVRADMRRLIKRVLRRHGYPPDKQEAATRTVLEQAELLCGDWAA